MTFNVLRAGLPDEVSAVTLRIATPSGEVVDRECAVGGSVEMTGNVGGVFTVVETLVNGTPIRVATKSSSGATEG